MKQRPILFSAPMVRAILEGRKTMTRRVVKPMPGQQREWLTDDVIHTFVKSGEVIKGGWQMWHPHGGPRSPFGWIRCPYGAPGDQLWVRETHAIVPRTAYAQSDGVQQVLRPDDNHDAAVFREGWDRSPPSRWRPSIHMPRWASRITLEIKSISVERLQDISEEDAKAEGIDDPAGTHCVKYTGRHIDGFIALWESINGPGSWDANPWVWVVEFERTEQEEV